MLFISPHTESLVGLLGFIFEKEFSAVVMWDGRRVRARRMAFLPALSVWHHKSGHENHKTDLKREIFKSYS